MTVRALFAVCAAAHLPTMHPMLLLAPQVCHWLHGLYDAGKETSAKCACRHAFMHRSSQLRMLLLQRLLLHRQMMLCTHCSEPVRSKCYCGAACICNVCFMYSFRRWPLLTFEEGRGQCSANSSTQECKQCLPPAGRLQATRPAGLRGWGWRGWGRGCAAPAPRRSVWCWPPLGLDVHVVV